MKKRVMQKIIVTDSGGVEHEFIEDSDTQHHIQFRPDYGDTSLELCVSVLSRSFSGRAVVAETEAEKIFLMPRSIEILYTYEDKSAERGEGEGWHC